MTATLTLAYEVPVSDFDHTAARDVVNTVRALGVLAGWGMGLRGDVMRLTVKVDPTPTLTFRMIDGALRNAFPMLRNVARIWDAAEAEPDHVRLARRQAEEDAHPEPVR